MNQTLRRLPVLVALLLVAASLACNANDLVGPASTVTPLSPPETLIPPTEPAPPTVAAPTLAPSDTPVPTAAVTATPSEVTVTAVGADVACRFGPASEYSIEGKLAGGVTTLALARNSSSTWIRIEHQSHPGRNCWLKATDVSVSGNLASVPVETAPVAIVTGVHVDLSPSEATVAGVRLPVHTVGGVLDHRHRADDGQVSTQPGQRRQGVGDADLHSFRDLSVLGSLQARVGWRPLVPG